jgi:RNA polymerase sigma factor (sigma-70 family)
MALGERRSMTERQLLERFVTENDPDAFRVFIERYGPMVLSVCRGILRDLHDVEDAFQNTFLILARRAGTIRKCEAIGPWMHRVAFRVAQRARYKSCQRLARERNTGQMEATLVLEPVEYPDHSLVSVLRQEVSLLPEKYRAPLVLCYLEGMTNEEAAARLRCPVGTIKGRLWRARQTLRDRLGHTEYGGFPH